MEIEYNSVCIYGISFEYDEIKEIKKKWYEVHDKIQLRMTRPFINCDDTCRMYHAGIIIDCTTPDHLLLIKEDVVKELKEFCEENKLQYIEPRITSWIDIY